MFKKLSSSILSSKMIFFDKNNQGRIINRIQNDTENIDLNLPWFLYWFLSDLNFAIGYPIAIM